VLQLVNTPDIYKENKYQRRNLLLYHCLLESGLRKFNVSEQLCLAGIECNEICTLLKFTMQRFGTGGLCRDWWLSSVNEATGRQEHGMV
jgi:hypothetical protein